MTDQTNTNPPGDLLPDNSTIYYDEPPVRRPPRTETGVLGWLRENLFGSATDTILTVIALVVILYSFGGFLIWSITEAEWGVITRNLRLFMNGRYPGDQIYRVSYVVLILTVLSGISWGLMARAQRWLAVAAAALLAVLFVTPALINPIPVPTMYQYINAESEQLLNSPVLLLQEGPLTMSLTPADPRAGIPVGFSDVDSATESGQAQLAIRTYDRQLARFEAGEEGVDAPEPLPEPDVQVSVRLLDGSTTEVVGTIQAGVNTDQDQTEVTFTIPHTGWYVIQAEYTGEHGAYWLAVDEISLVSSSSEEQANLIGTYGPIPEIEGVRTKLADSAFLRFRGTRTLAQFLRLQVAPLFEASRTLTLGIIVAVAVGYAAGVAVRKQHWARRVLNYAWTISFIIIVFLLRGFYIEKNYSEVIGFGLLLLTLAFAGFALYSVFSVNITAKEERAWFFNGGMVLVLGIALLTLMIGWNWPFLILIAAGTASIAYALDDESRIPYLRMVGIGLAGVAAYFVVMWALFGQQIDTFVNSGGTEMWPLAFVPTDRWGGLVLTLALALVSIIASFPIGVLLALGRRSDLPVIRLISIGAIEVVRGVPLITILFMASIMVPLLSPSFANVDSVVRSMIGMTLFSGAYVAEIVRGGLQAIPHGQIEAARAVGLSPWQTMAFIVLPQALRAVIPALVGQFISLFKDTSLVFIIGLIELLGVARTVINQAEYIGTQREALVFIGFIYFVGSYAMSSASRRIEESGVGSVRRM